MDVYRELFLMQQTYATLFSLANKLQVQGDKYLGKLTARQYMTMLAIAHLPEDKTTLNNIARKLGSTKQSVKHLITSIESKGYVITVPSKVDKRAVNVKITESAKHVLLECAEKGLYLLADIFNDFTKVELETLWGLLKKLYRFDGVEQDGFEGDTDFEIGEEGKETQERALKEFERRRNKSKRERGNNEE